MAGCDSPGIAGLHRLISEHGEAVEADLLRLGLDIRDLGGALSYRRLRVILENSPRDSAYLRSAGGDYATWSTTDHLLALIKDELAIANWQRCDPKARVPYPKPQSRPGVDGPERSAKPQNVRSITQARAWAARRREA